MADIAYTLTADEVACAHAVAARRNALNGGQSNIPGGETASPDERLRQHQRACVAEIAVSRVLNLAWTGCGKGAQGLRDVGYHVEVRSIGARGRGLLVRPRDPDDAPYLLVLVDSVTSRASLLGWAMKGEVMAHGERHAADTEKECWILRERQLHPVQLRRFAAML